jgi:hypothetical protein
MRTVALLLLLPLLGCLAIPMEPQPDVEACADAKADGARARQPPPIPEGATCAALRKHLVVGVFPGLYQYMLDDDIGEAAHEARDYYPPKGLNWPARMGMSGVLALGIAGWNTVTFGVPTAFMWLGEPFLPWSANSLPCYPSALGFCKIERWTPVAARQSSGRDSVR